MPFNGAGLYSPPGADYPVLPNTLIQSALFNDLIADVSTALSNCITKDGQQVVTNNIPFAGFRLTGVGAPAATNDALTYGTAAKVQQLIISGVASPAAIAGNTNDYAPVGLATAGTLRLSSSARFNVTGLTGGTDGRVLAIHNVGTFPIVFTYSDVLSVAANRFAFGTTLGGGQTMTLQYDITSALWRGVSLPVSIGTLEDFAGGTVPAGYLLRDGSNISRTTYAALFNEIGTTWGVGDGATTFGVGDDRRKTYAGSGGAGTGTLGNAVGNTGGEEGHVLSIGELAAHGHGISDNVRVTSSGAIQFSNGAPQFATDAAISATSTGSGTAHNTIQPSNVVTKMIRYC